MKWYQVKARLERVQEDASQKMVSENYLVQAFSFGMAEETIRNEIAPFASGEFDIVAVARKNYSEIITDKSGIESRIDAETRPIMEQKSASMDVDKWFKCKLNLIALDPGSGKEKKTAQFFLVNANTALTAHRLVDNFMRGTLSDYEVEQIDETKILDVFKIASEDEK